MQKTTNKPATKNHILTLNKEIGNLWTLRDITPFGKKFEQFFEENLGHDISKLTVISAVSYVLDILSGGEKQMDVELCLAEERLTLPGYVEFALVDPGRQAAKYYVNNCPGCPQLQAWVNASIKKFFKDYPAFAYIKKK